MVGVGLLAVAVIVLVALLVPRMTSSDSPGIVTESGASSAATDDSAARRAGARLERDGVRRVGRAAAARQNPAPRQRTAGAARARARQPGRRRSPSAPAVVGAHDGAPRPAERGVPPVPGARPAACTVRHTRRHRSRPRRAADTATPVGGTGSTGSNTPVGTGGHGTGQTSSTPPDTGGTATAESPPTTGDGSGPGLVPRHRRFATQLA